MTFYDKIKWVLGILIVFVLIISTNLVDRNNFETVKNSVETIYKDRLIAKDLIYKIHKSLSKKEIALVTEDKNFFVGSNKLENKEISELIFSFEKTKLTKEEEKTFKELKENFQKQINLEADILINKFQKKENLRKNLLDIKENLHELSQIQISEGNKQLSISKKAFDTVDLFTQIEIYLLIFLAITIQIIVMYNPKKYN